MLQITGATTQIEHRRTRASRFRDQTGENIKLFGPRWMALNGIIHIF
jgi:hypothetical protein